MREDSGSLFVEFAHVAKQSAGQPLKMVLDFGQGGEVLGVEIINLALKAGRNSLRTIDESVRTQGSGLRYSYDEDSDSFYLRLKAGKSADQKAVEGVMFRDDEGRIIALNAEWE